MFRLVSIFISETKYDVICNKENLLKLDGLSFPVKAFKAERMPQSHTDLKTETDFWDLVLESNDFLFQIGETKKKKEEVLLDLQKKSAEKTSFK